MSTKAKKAVQIEGSAISTCDKGSERQPLAGPSVTATVNLRSLVLPDEELCPFSSCSSPPTTNHERIIVCPIPLVFYLVGSSEGLHSFSSPVTYDRLNAIQSFLQKSHPQTHQHLARSGPHIKTTTAKQDSFTMAEQLNMNGLSLADSQHAGPNGFHGAERSAYIPPHARNAPRGAPAPAANGLDGAPPAVNGAANGAWPAPAQA